MLRGDCVVDLQNDSVRGCQRAMLRPGSTGFGEIATQFRNDYIREVESRLATAYQHVHGVVADELRCHVAGLASKIRVPPTEC